MRLTERVYLVGSGKSGADISNPYDSHVYLIDGASSLALIDAGAGIQPELIIENIRQEGFDPANVSTIALTHAHADHGGGASALQTATGAEILAPGPAATWLIEANESAISLPEARAGGTYPNDYHLTPCSTALAIADGDKVQIGDVHLQTIDTPGHAAAHVSFLLHGDDRIGVFGGDVVFHGGKILLLATPDCSIQELIKSMCRLEGIMFDALFPGHGVISLNRGKEQVAQAHRMLCAQQIPPNYST
jgi:hydroxyacylglutathione hydrolase